MPRLDLRTLSLLVIPPMMWAGNAVIGRLMIGALPPLLMNTLRWAIVGLLLLPLAWRVARRPTEVLQRWPYLVALGVLGVGSYNALQYLALQTSLPLNVTLIGASAPVWMMLVGWLGFGQRLQARQVMGAALSVCGVVLVIAQGQWAVLRQVRLVPGDMLMLVASLAWAIYSWLLAHPPAHMTGERRPQWDWAEFLWVQVVIGVLWASLCTGADLLWLADQAVARPWWPMAWQTWAGLLFIAVGPSIWAYRSWGLGVQAVGPTVASFFANLTPIFAALWSAILLGQHPRWYHPVALVLIMAGIAVSSLKPREAPAASRPAARA